MNGTRLARNVSAGAVAGIAAWSSWSHMVHVALRYGERAEVAYVLPLSVDGMLVVATVAMADDKRCGRTVRLSARVAFLAGVVASVAANIAAAQPSVGARIVAGWPALALLLVVEILSRSGRRLTVAGPVAVETPATVPATGVDQLHVDPEDATQEPPAVTEEPPALKPSRRPVRRQTAADRVVKAAARTPAATPAQLAARLKLSERTVQRYLSRPADDTTTTAQQPSEQVNGRTPALVTADPGGTP